MKEKFVDHSFNAASLNLIKTAIDILEKYKVQGYKLSLRQLYYQFVAHDIFPEDRRWSWTGKKWVRDPNGTKNATPNYKWLGAFVSDARLAGLLDWNMIEDRGRETVINTHWKNPAHIIRSAADQFKIDHWEGQTCYVEVMVEKDALSGILEPVCRRLDIRFTANKGYSSNSAMYEAAERIAREYRNGKEIHLFYLGDHDPSGIDMTRDIKDRLALFTYDSIDIQTVRLALNIDQVEKLQPPENPAKETDSRYQVYVEQFGESSWELDAVEPATLASLVEDAVRDLIDQDVWNEVEERESAMRQELERYADDYENKGD